MIRRIALLSLCALAACGGSSPDPGGGAPATNVYSGTVSVTGALAAGTTTCQGTAQVVTFKPAAAGADVHTVTVPGGGCVQFVNADGAAHQPAARTATVGCTALNAPAALANGGSFTTGPLGAGSGPVSCDWIDALNPPGGGGGGY